MEKRSSNIALERTHIGQAIEKSGVVSLVGNMESYKTHICFVTIGYGPVEINEEKTCQCSYCYEHEHPSLIWTSADSFQIHMRLSLPESFKNGRGSRPEPETGRKDVHYADALISRRP